MNSELRVFAFVAVLVGIATTLISLFPVTRALSKIEPEAFDLTMNVFLRFSLLRLGLAFALVGLAIWVSSTRHKFAWGLLLLTPVLVFVADTVLRFIGR